MKIAISSSVSNFSQRLYEAWGLREYEPLSGDAYRPVVFFGMYHLIDYTKFFLNRSDKSVLWLGSDIIQLRFPFTLLFKHIRASHYCENKVEQTALKRKGIKAVIRPIFCERPDRYPISYKYSPNAHIYTTMHDNRENEYGLVSIKKLAQIFKTYIFHIYGVKGQNNQNIIFHGNISEKQFDNEIKNYQCALRLNKFDGFADITAKSVLMGQYPITMIKYPHIWKADNLAQVIKFLDKLRKMKEPNYKAAEYYRKNLNAFSWLIHNF